MGRMLGGGKRKDKKSKAEKKPAASPERRVRQELKDAEEPKSDKGSSDSGVRQGRSDLDD